MPFTISRVVTVILIIATTFQFFFYNQSLAEAMVIVDVLFLISVFSDLLTGR